MLSFREDLLSAASSMSALGSTLSLCRVRFYKGLGHLRDLLPNLLGHSFEELFDPVGVDPVHDVDLGCHQHRLRSKVHGEQAQDLRNLGKGEHSLTYPSSILRKDRFADQQPTRVGTQFPGDEEE